MPLIHVTVDGKPGWRYGSKGKVYTYKAGDKAASMAAKKKAIAQAIAIQKSSGQKAHL